MKASSSDKPHINPQFNSSVILRLVYGFIINTIIEPTVFSFKGRTNSFFSVSHTKHQRTLRPKKSTCHFFKHRNSVEHQLLPLSNRSLKLAQTYKLVEMFFYKTNLLSSVWSEADMLHCPMKRYFTFNSQASN